MPALSTLTAETRFTTPRTETTSEASSPDDVKKITLDNGLRIFVLERTATPTFAAHYRFGVGGATDPKGQTGIAHLLEHLLLSKGTRTFGTLGLEKELRLMARQDELWKALYAELDRRDDPFRSAEAGKIEELREEIEKVAAEHKSLIAKNEQDELMFRAGRKEKNASTSTDVTKYYMRLPANRLEFWFRMESDRMLRPVFREFYSERDVVLEERRMSLDDNASGLATLALRSLMYTAHPYGRPVIGWVHDLERLERKQAVDYFKTYYSPSNCIMVLVGDVRAAEVERLAKKYFGDWQRQEIPRLRMTAEPPQRGERRRIVEFDADPQLKIGWVTVPAGHPDQYPLDVLARILGGMSSSRLDQAMLHGERLATRVSASHYRGRYAGEFHVFGQMSGSNAAELEGAFLRALDRIRTDGVTADEVERALTAAEASRVRELTSNAEQASRIADAVWLSGDTAYLDEYRSRLEAVTSERVREVASRYLTSERMNVVELRQAQPGRAADTKTKSSGAGVKHGEDATAPVGQHSKGFEQAMEMLRRAEPVSPGVLEIGKEVRRVELDSGITVFIKEDHSAPSIDLSFRWLGGRNTEPLDEIVRYWFAGDLIGQGGTKELTPAEVEERKDRLGMTFSVGSGSTLCWARFWSLARNFDESLDLALDILMHPRFDSERLETLKSQSIARMRRRGESARGAADVLRRHLTYGQHPRRGYIPSKKEIEAVTPEELREVWRRHFGRDNLFITAVGDFESEKMLALLEKRLGSWRKAKKRKREFIENDPLLRPGTFLVKRDLAQSSIVLYHQIPVDIRASMEDHAALDILQRLFGFSTFRSRLGMRLRSDEGLTYGIYANLFHSARPGTPGGIRIFYETKSEAGVRSIDRGLDEPRRIITEKPTVWSNGFVFRYTNDTEIVRRLMLLELDDQPYDYDRRLFDAVQKVTPEDVHRVAKKYLMPESLTIAIYGTPAGEDLKALTERFGLQVLDFADVFTGGYDVDEKNPQTAMPR
jgi:predicted Zn-dependent peptidase